MRYDQKIEQLDDAIQEAERFIRRAREAVKACESEWASKYRRAYAKELASAKRASMDLTRALVFVRKSGD